MDETRPLVERHEHVDAGSGHAGVHHGDSGRPGLGAGDVALDVQEQARTSIGVVWYRRHLQIPEDWNTMNWN